MKKYHIILIWLCTIKAGAVYSQTVPNHTLALGIDAYAFFTLRSDDPSGRIFIAPLIEYYPFNNLGAGVKGIIDYRKLTSNGFTEIRTRRIIQPYVKYFAYRGLHVLAGSQLDLEYDYQANLHWGVGYSHFFSRRVAFTPLIEFNHNFDQYAIRPFAINFSIGASYFFK